MGSLLTDIRHALRGLLNHPGFTAAAVLTLAIGIGACTAIFTVVNAVLLESLPFREPDRIVRLHEISDKARRINVPEANFVDWKEEATSFESMAIHNAFTVTVIGSGEPERVRLSQVSREFFDVLGVTPRAGRTFVAEELEDGAPGAVIVSHRYWRDALGAPSDLSSVELRIGGSESTVVGVMPTGFDYPPGAELWMPQEAVGPLNPSRSAHNWRVVARLGPDKSIGDATAEMNTIAERLHGQYDDVTAVGAEATSLHHHLTSSVQKPLMILSGAVLILLLVACANVMNLFLARATTRQRESAVRAALGASRWRLMQPMVAESLLVTVVGGVLGVALAAWGVDALLKLGRTLPRAEEVSVDPKVVGFSLLLSIVVALIVGIVPGLRVGKGAQASLKDGARGSAGERHGLRGALVMVQVGLTLVLLVGAGLLGNSFWRLLSVDLGFETESRLVAVASLPPVNDEADAVRRIQTLQRIQERLRAIPGVETTGGSSALPLSRWGANGRFLIENAGDSGDYWPSYRAASPGFFETLGISLIVGRTFEDRDTADAPQVAVISRKVADAVWPDGNAIGKRINTGNMDGDHQTYTTIVGIVEDVREEGADEASKGTVYVNAFQRPGAAGTFMNVLLTTGDPRGLVPEVRSVIKTIDPEIPVRFETFDEIYRSSLSGRTFDLALLLVFGGTALLLALVGIYGVMSYTIARRIPEIGVRMALGAEASDVVWLFLKEGGQLVLYGMAGGLVLTFAISRVLSSLLFEVDATDVVTYAGVALPMIAVALVACWIPARQGTLVDPLVALRDE